MATIIGVVSTKGGPGKTTCTFNLGGILADMGLRTLLIDGDSQQSLTSCCPLDQRAKNGLTKLVTTADPTGCISKTKIKNLDIVMNDDPRGEKGGLITTFLAQSASHHTFLSLALTDPLITENYDAVLIDTLGTESALQESVIYASDQLVSPVIPNYIDVRELVTRMMELLSRLKPVRGGMLTISGKPLPPLKILINLRDKQQVDQRDAEYYLRTDFLEEIKEGYPGIEVGVLANVIYKRAVFNKATSHCLPAHRLDHRRKRPESECVLEMMRAIAWELMSQLDGVEPQWDKKGAA